jgi:LPXTG-motif cell wall-anchored protein
MADKAAAAAQSSTGMLLAGAVVLGLLAVLMLGRRK